jgi:hypothetical protein
VKAFSKHLFLISILPKIWLLLGIYYSLFPVIDKPNTKMVREARNSVIRLRYLFPINKIIIPMTLSINSEIEVHFKILDKRRSPPTSKIKK